jgi:hypothetical protein
MASVRPVQLHLGYTETRFCRFRGSEAFISIDAEQSHVICFPARVSGVHRQSSLSQLAALSSGCHTEGSSLNRWLSTKPMRNFHMSKKAADHHKQAAEHHTHAARHHTEAAKHHESGNHEKAAHHAHSSRAHAAHANEHAETAAKAHIEEHGNK